MWLMGETCKTCFNQFSDKMILIGAEQLRSQGDQPVPHQKTTHWKFTELPCPRLRWRMILAKGLEEEIPQ